MVADAAQVCTGMQSLVSVGIVHGDLAARNVLVFDFDERVVAKVRVKVRMAHV